LNVQVERLENHTAQLTAEIESERFEQAKQKAAQQLSKRINIPGFRKGKAPYRILVNYVGEGAILEEAVELLGNDMYNDVVSASGIDPYGSGEIVNISLEATPPTIQYRVALQPEVDLAGYRDVRVDYKPVEVTDDMVNRTMKALQEQHAIVEQSYRPVERGNRITINVHSHFVGADHVHAEGEAEHDHDHDHGDEDVEEFMHEHDFPLLLDDDGEPLPGFIDAVTGMNAGETRTFDLVVPDDKEEYGDIAGRMVHFGVTVTSIEAITLPALNDDFAARVTAEREKQLTLLELRMEARENLQTFSDDRYRSDYVIEALDAIVAQASIRYPEGVIIDQINNFLNDFDQRLRQQGLTLRDYVRLANRTLEQIAEDYRPAAVRTVERGLVARTLGAAEGLTISADNIEEEVKRLIERAEEDKREQVRQLLARRDMVESVANDLLMGKLYDRIVAIAKGEEVPLPPATPTETTQNEGETA
jgi:trigger factor